MKIDVKRILKNKLVILILLIGSILFINSLFPKINLTNRAIVLALGIDKGSAENEITLSIQYVIPTRAGGQGGTEFSNDSHSGQSVEDILSQLSIKIGSLVSLAHCDIIIIGEELAKQQNIAYLKYFMNDESVADTTMLAVSQTTALDILLLNIPKSTVASYQLRSTLYSKDNTPGIVPVNMINFFQNNSSITASNHLPYLTIEPFESDRLQDGTNAENTKKYGTINAQKTAIFNSYGMQEVLSESENLGLSYVAQKMKYGNISLKSDLGDILVVEIVSVKTKIKTDILSLTATITVDVKGSASSKQTANFKTSKVSLTDSEKSRLSGIVSGNIYECFYKSKDNDVDIFALDGVFYKYHGNKWKNIAKTDYLKNVQINVKVNAKIVS